MTATYMRPGRVATLTLALLLVAVGAAQAALKPGGKVIAKIAIPSGYGGFAVGEGAVWAMSDDSSRLTRIDGRSNAVVARIKIAPGGELAAGNGAVWVTHPTDGTVSRVDSDTNREIATIKVGPGPQGIATSPGAVWVANSGGPTVSHIDPATNQVVATIRVGPRTATSDRMQVTASGTTVWVAVPGLSAVVRIDAATNRVVATIHTAAICGFLLMSKNAVWAAGAHCAAMVVRIDPHANRANGKVKGKLSAPIGLVLAFGSLWVADLDAKTIDRVDTRSGRIVARLPVGGYPIRLGVGFGSIWVRDDTGRVLRIRPNT
ncbi:MAG: virginiamycin lyase [Gaiellaceae bacterium]|jgi:YVTN family beta-propeller protein|nr:virginiamycin lyase [Gaiellaceae bacterium]